jgi:acetoin utilization deacetylase AcuC-like enzyme
VVALRLLLSTQERFVDHDTGRGHPERPARLAAVLDGIGAAGVADAVVPVAPRPATRAELELVHPPDFLDAVERFCSTGGGALDADTVAGAASWEAAVLAAGAGPDAIERLERGEADSAFCVVRPPGHHATPNRAMGFCLVNNVAVAAAVLAERGERVVVIDFDAHHGNGTQAAFYADPRVLYVSMHEFPLYPFTGRLGEVGVGEGVGTTVNLPMPSGLTGDVALAAMDEVVAPVVEGFAPTWLLVSAGFDGHRRDPLTGLGLSSADFADLTRRALEMAPPGRRLAFLEGGYDLQALHDSAGAFVAALVGQEHRPEAPTSGGPGRAIVDAAVNALLAGR